MTSKLFKRAFLLKPVDVALREADETHSKLERNLTLFDLLCIGVGGTVGSGMFVLTGFIAKEYAGPGVILSWVLGGIACCMSAAAYAELSCIIPSAGSSYVYVYLGLGELPAYITGWCLTLEYGVSGAAVASSWGNKIASLVLSWNGSDYPDILQKYNILGGLLQFVIMLILLRGTQISKVFVNFFTILKLILVAFIIIGGLSLFNQRNISVFLPFGAQGVVRGAASCFFGYLGYDEVCCLAGEAINPQRNLPLAVNGTIIIITFIFVLGAIALAGMQPYSLIDASNGFGMAFAWNGWEWAHQLVAFGEVVTLPVVVLVGFIAQPRLQYALAVDGLLPSIFAEVDNNGTLSKGILISGLILTIVTIFAPFTFLDDVISAGVLISYNFTNTSLILLRFQRKWMSETMNESDINGNNDNCVNSAGNDIELKEDIVDINSANQTVLSIMHSNYDIVETSSRHGQENFVGDPRSINSDYDERFLLKRCLLWFHIVSVVVCVCLTIVNYEHNANTVIFVITAILVSILIILSISIRSMLQCPDYQRHRRSKLAIAMIFYDYIRKGISHYLSLPLNSNQEKPEETGIESNRFTSPTQNSNLNPHKSNGSSDHHIDPVIASVSLYEVPFMPFIPLLGIVINYYLFLQLSLIGLFVTFIVFIFAIITYFTFSIHYSVGNSTHWESNCNSHSTNVPQDSQSSSDILDDDLTDTENAIELQNLVLTEKRFVVPHNGHLKNDLLMDNFYRSHVNESST